ncbi:MAG: hypothetical protein HYX35_01915 [Proteobacteria bacterium]|nr:hypothetical protein [Pseudomonadota bacterium]
MKDKFLLYLTDEEIILYKGAAEKIATFTGSFEESVPILETHLGPKGSLCLLIDRTQQDIHEEKLPPLFFWDRARLLFHKKVSCSSQGGYASFHFLKQEGDVYLRWVHLPQQDPIVPWIDFIKVRAGHVFFVALEGGRLLGKKLSSSKGYHMVLYSSPSQKMRHMVFKGKRLLLVRTSQGEEDIKGSLHFLSRTYADIHETLEVVECDSQELISSVVSQKKSSFPLALAAFSTAPWIRKSMGAGLSLICLWTGVEVYEGSVFKRKTPFVLSEGSSLKEASQALTSRLDGKDVSWMRRALAHYDELKPSKTEFLQDIQQLSLLLKMYPIRLESMRWHQEQQLEILLSFLIEECDTKNEALETFEAFLLSAHEHFPNSHLQVLEAPFKSGPQETFKDSSEGELPRVQVKIVGL